MAERVLISGKANSGKTTLLKALPADDTFIIAVDEKPFPFEIPHSNVYGFSDIESFINGEDIENEDGDLEHIDGMFDKLQIYKEKYDKLPKYVGIDSVSRVFQIAYDNLNARFPNDNFKLYAALDREIKILREFLIQLQDNGVDVIMVSHALYDEKEDSYKMVDKGSFSKSGGFLSIVDYAIFVEVKGKKRTIHHRNPSLASRTLIEDIPDKEPVEDFNLHTYLEKLESSKKDVQQFTI